MENRKNKVNRERYKGFEIVTDTEDRQRRSKIYIISILEEKEKAREQN